MSKCLNPSKLKTVIFSDEKISNLDRLDGMRNYYEKNITQISF